MALEFAKRSLRPSDAIERPLAATAFRFTGAHHGCGECPSSACQLLLEHLRRYAILIGKQTNTTRREYLVEEGDERRDDFSIVQKIGPQDHGDAQIRRG